MFEALLPAIGPRAILAAIGFALIAFLAAALFFAGVEHERGNTIALDAQWRLKLETANHEAENEANRRVQEAAEAASRVAPAGPTPADVDRLCKADPACRDKRKPG
jgi:hypothetical protein